MTDKSEPTQMNTTIVKESFQIDWEEVRNIVAWVAGAMAIVLVAWAPVKCTMDSNERIAQAIESGVNPIDAQCAFGNLNDQSKCAIRAAVSKEGKAE